MESNCSKGCNWPLSPPDRCARDGICIKTWPELVGSTGEEAAEKIKTEMPATKIEFVAGPPWVYQQDYRPNRVRIAVDSSNKVGIAPISG